MLKDTKQSSAATTAVLFITVGALMVVWSSVYYFYLSRHEASDSPYFWCYGFFFSGWVLVLIGIGLGRIGRVVRDAEVTTGLAQPATPPAPPASAAASVQPIATVSPTTTTPGTPVRQL